MPAPVIGWTDAHSQSPLLTRGVPVDYQRSTNLCARACEGGSALGCTNLSLAYYRGQGVIRSFEKSAQYAKRACNGGDPSGCGHYGYLYESGNGQATDIEAATEYYEYACNAGVGNFCYRLGVLKELNPTASSTEQEALHLYKRACEAGNPAGCATIKVFFEAEIPPIEQWRLDQYNVSYSDGCAQGEPRECGILGLLQLAYGDTNEGERYINKGCGLGDQWSCAQLKKINFFKQDHNTLKKSE